MLASSLIKEGKNRVINLGNDNVLNAETNWPSVEKFQFFDTHVAKPIKPSATDKATARD